MGKNLVIILKKVLKLELVERNFLCHLTFFIIFFLRVRLVTLQKILLTLYYAKKLSTKFKISFYILYTLLNAKNMYT